jgi:heme/copper-type cytochrome/quinol oxidase subunit 2
MKKVSNYKMKVILSLFTFFISFFTVAQCAMCRASLQNDANKATAEGINDGIVYLMAIPYILVAVVFYWVYKIRKRKA